MSTDTGLFRAHPRVVYEINPIQQVICQLRFPQILRIGAEAPALFQEALRRKLPIYRAAATKIAKEVPSEIAQLLKLNGTVSHVFATPDDSVQVTLETSSIAVVTNEYRSWEEYGSLVNECFELFGRFYSPSYYERAGLRYINVIDKFELGLQNDPWKNLIEPRILSELNDDEWANSTTEVSHAIRASLNQLGDFIFFQHGYAINQHENRQCYFLDFDYYSDQRVEVGDAAGVIERLHGFSGRAFRDSITEKLHQALRPKQ